MTVMRISGYLERLFHPSPRIGGLEITSSAVRFLLMQGGEEILTVSSRIPPGTIVGGVVKDPITLRAALKEVHQRVAPLKETVAVVLLLPSEHVYLQSFSLPFLENRALEEAVNLNLKMLSPIDPTGAYAGWQRVGEKRDQNQMELLAAFAPREVVDMFAALAGEAGFSVAAVEFPALALARVAETWGALPQESQLLIRIATEGVELMILRDAHLYFHQFTNWGTLQEEFRTKTVSLEDLRTFLAREVQRFMSFYSGKWGGALAHAILVAEQFEGELLDFLRTTFAFDARPLSLTSFSHLPPLWLPVLGAAERGRMPRARDTFINLRSESARDEYEHARTVLFIRLWRNALLTLTSFFLVLFVLMDSFLARQIVRLEEERGGGAPPALTQELQALQAEAQAFSLRAELIAQAHAQGIAVAPIMNAFERARGDRVTMKRITLSPGGTLSVSGVGIDEASVIVFKNNLLREPLFTDVELPPSNLTVGEKDTVLFTAALMLSSSVPVSTP